MTEVGYEDEVEGSIVQRRRGHYCIYVIDGQGLRLVAAWRVDFGIRCVAAGLLTFEQRGFNAPMERVVRVDDPLLTPSYPQSANRMFRVCRLWGDLRARFYAAICSVLMDPCFATVRP